MIDRIVNFLFRWDSLRNAIIDEVHMYDNIDKILSDPKEMQIASCVYPDSDGWRGWTKNIDINRYYFNDIPEDSLMDAHEQLRLMEIRSYKIEFDTDEIW
jgi:hypothetical protein